MISADYVVFHLFTPESLQKSALDCYFHLYIASLRLM